MSTFTTITATFERPVPVSWVEARFGAYMARDTEYDIDWLTSGSDGQLDFRNLTSDDATGYTTELRFWANTKYTLDGSQQVASAMSGAYPVAKVSWSESWDDEDGGEEQADYRNGVVTAERESQIVPKDLGALMKDLEAALGNLAGGDPLVTTARALVKAYRA